MIWSFLLGFVLNIGLFGEFVNPYSKNLQKERVQSGPEPAVLATRCPRIKPTKARKCSAMTSNGGVLA
jgi:hypothetical protein